MMSTRANIVIRDSLWSQEHKLWFYRHSDGYPEGAMPTLQKFIKWLRQGKIRDNVSQASGWLILIGAAEYDEEYDSKTSKWVKKKSLLTPNSVDGFGGWKCGAYEPTTGVHGDIEYLYIIDLTAKTISCFQSWDDEGNPKGKPILVDTTEKPYKMKG